MKHCPRCNEDKPLSDFYRSSRYKDGHAAWCKPCMHAHQRATRKPRNPAAQKIAHLKRTFGLTQSEYETMYTAQNGLCAVCGNPEVRTDHRTGNIKDLAVDHDHATGEMRALLCTSCNMALGLLQDDPKRIEQLLRYIQRYEVKV